jgi:ectoine hydroxylase-related dioxygenase (phytanoyl-CoA dioxygenase family)
MLSKTQVDAYWRDGFLAVRRVFDAEDVSRWHAECDRLWKSVDVNETNARVQWRGHRKQGRIADRLDPVMDISPEFDRLASDPRLTGVAAAAVGSDVAIMKGTLIMKRPGTMGYDMHQDFPYWEFLGVPADHMVIAAIPMDVWNAESGAIEFFPGRHHERIPGPEGAPLDTDPSKVDLTTGVIMQLRPGDIGLFHALTPHRSGPNHSDHGRRTLYFAYVRAEHGDIRTRYYAERPT